MGMLRIIRFGKLCEHDVFVKRLDVCAVCGCERALPAIRGQGMVVVPGLGGRSSTDVRLQGIGSQAEYPDLHRPLPRDLVNKE